MTSPRSAGAGWRAIGLVGLLVGAACTETREADSGEAATTTVPDTVTTSTATTTTEPAIAEPTTTTTTTTVPQPATTTTTTTVPQPATTTTTTTTAPAPDGVRFVVPVARAVEADWGDTHSTYPATDIFVPGGCGGEVVSPVDGAVLEVRRVDEWEPAVDNPATRGGRSITILGADGVRYYLAHFDVIDEAIQVGATVRPGRYLGTVGDTGRSSACHLHFGISPLCPDPEWAVRRGVVWPFPYLDAWLTGESLGPSTEVLDWSKENPDACAEASADPNARDG